MLAPLLPNSALPAAGASRRPPAPAPPTPTAPLSPSGLSTSQLDGILSLAATGASPAQQAPAPPPWGSPAHTPRRKLVGATVYKEHLLTTNQDGATATVANKYAAAAGREALPRRRFFFLVGMLLGAILGRALVTIAQTFSTIDTTRPGAAQLIWLEGWKANL
tara:strand:+ start:96 stop:584 length:489 start_codon:yes stop_codon:yes gene_type:complete